jgi:hypothetical protein
MNFYSVKNKKKSYKYNFNGLNYKETFLYYY